MKQAALFLLKFMLASALLLALWPPVSWVYGPLLGSAANAFFALVQPYVSVEVGDRAYLLYYLWPDVIRCEVRDFGVIYLNALVVTALFAALPGGPRGRLKALGAVLLALFASHILCLYLLSYVTVWNSLLHGTGPAQQASFRLLTDRANAVVSHQTALICGKVYALWGAYGWEGLPFLAGALAFITVRRPLRVKRHRPSPAARPRPRAAPNAWMPSAGRGDDPVNRPGWRTQRRQRLQGRRRVQLLEQRPLPPLRGEL